MPVYAKVFLIVCSAILAYPLHYFNLLICKASKNDRMRILWLLNVILIRILNSMSCCHFSNLFSTQPCTLSPCSMLSRSTPICVIIQIVQLMWWVNSFFPEQWLSVKTQATCAFTLVSSMKAIKGRGGSISHPHLVKYPPRWSFYSFFFLFFCLLSQRGKTSLPNEDVPHILTQRF